MRKTALNILKAYTLIVAFVGILAPLAHSQQNRFPPINLYNGDPTGNACTFPASPLLQSQTTGFIYGCNPNTHVYQQVAAGANAWPGYPAAGIPCSNASSWCPSYGVSNQIPLTYVASFGTVNLSDWTNAGVLNGYVPVWNSGTGKWTPGPQTGSGSTNVTTVTTAAPSQRSGGLQANDPIASITPVCDIRSWGAVIDDATDIGFAVQVCINKINSQYGATGTILLPCARQNSTGPGCYWANPSALTGPSAGTVKFELQGGLQVGSTLNAYNWGSWFGIGNGTPGQFQTGTIPAAIFGPAVNGTLGTAITSANTATTITPTFTQGSITNLPVGSAITIAGVGSSSATASRVSSVSPAGYGLTTYTLSSSTLRIPPGEIATITGCSPSTFNAANIAVDASDFTAQTITVLQTTTTVTTATGCTVTGFNEDKFESARILASGTNSGTFNGVTYSAPGAGNVTIMTSHTHLNTDQWGEVGVAPAFNTYNPQTFSDLSFYNSYGMQLWSEGGSNLTLLNDSFQAGAYITSGALELSANYLSHIHNVYAQSSAYGQSVPACPNGGCQQPSYPYAIRCDADAPVGGYYSAAVSGCDATTIDGGSTVVGGIKLDGSGYEAVNGMPLLTDLLFEEPWGSNVMIDNRFGGSQAHNCLTLKNQYLQDNISGAQQYLVGYTDGGQPPSGCVHIENGTFAGALTNPYFDGNLTNTMTIGASRQYPPNNVASSGLYDQGNLFAGEVENEGASFGPQILAFGSLPIQNYTLASWQTLAAAVGNATVSAVVGPDGPSGSMLSLELDTTTIDRHIPIGTYSVATYPGDHFLIGSYVRPGTGESITQGLIAGNIGQGNSFYINSGGNDHFAIGANAGGTNLTCAPAAFGTQLQNNGWGAQVSPCTVLTGDSTPHTVTLYAAATNGGAGSTTVGNQFGGPFWVFIPGPNNPACTAAGTCNLTSDQIEQARRDQYHGCVPPGSTAGQLATCEAGGGGAGTWTGSGTQNYYPLINNSGGTSLGNSTIDHGVTTTNYDTDTYNLAAPIVKATGNCTLTGAAGAQACAVFPYSTPATGGVASAGVFQCTSSGCEQSINNGAYALFLYAGGPGGTPSSMTGTNITGVPLTTGVTGLLPHANIAATAVTPGSYTSANITVAADGSITAAANGSGGTPAYPLTISGGVSGGVVYGSSSTQLTVSPAGTANVLMKWGGAAAAPANSSVTDNGTAVTSTDTGGYVAPVFVANGTTAGFVDYPQGSTSAAVAPCNTANSICLQAPTSVTSQLRVFAGSPATGTPYYSNSSGTMTETINPGFSTATNCSSSASPAVCGSASAGSVLIPTGTTSSTLVVNTTAVTANSQIFFYPDDTLGTKLSTTCNSTLSTLIGGSAITARTAGTSFTITFNGTIVTNGVCGSFTVIN